tara:strand:+ start:1084 stop:2568 length:1485 start_codon:yes stop_codon:yes gene_type:complete
MNKETDSIKDNSKPLSNMRIAITSIDLEQAEHRGIAYLSKSLIRSLSDQGAQVYLLTGFHGRRLNPIMKFLMNDFSVNEVDSADILDQLSDTKINENIKLKKLKDGETYLDKLFNKLIDLRKKSNQILSLIKPIFKFYIKGALYSGRLIELKDIETSPYWGEERIDYLKYVNGFFSIPNIFLLTTLRSRRVLIKTPIIDLRKHNIDFLVTTCPLSLEVKSKQKYSFKILQLIMDFIPLSFYKHPDHPYSFYNRLEDAMKSRCCFISKNSRNKICKLFDKSIDKYQDNIIYPMPSLNLESLNFVNNIGTVRGIDCKFILFNSSIVPRKNLHFLIKAFQSSCISAKGFKLCVAGKIHNDNYGDKIYNICDNDPSINLLGYVNEIEKAWLFLNAHAFASPSCVEGFGIPVLDAYILGVNVLASNIPSHKEIADIKIDNGHLKLLDLSNIDSWISAIAEIGKAENYDISKTKRISNFESSFEKLKNLFDNKLLELINK